MKSVQLYNCPSYTGAVQTTNATTGQWVYNSGASYGWNVYATSTSAVVTPFHLAALATVENPAGTIFCGDSTYYRMGGYLPNTGNASVDNMRRVDPRHLDGTNFVWADGHVKWLPLSKVIYNAGDPVPGVWTLSASD